MCWNLAAGVVAGGERTYSAGCRALVERSNILSFSYHFPFKIFSSDNGHKIKWLSTEQVYFFDSLKLSLEGGHFVKGGGGVIVSLYNVNKTKDPE